MKFFTLTLLLICVIQIEMNGQASYGMKGGINGSWMGIENEKMKFGFHAGAYGSIDVSPNTHLQAEFMYSQKGANFNNLLLYDIPLLYTYHYLSLPVMIGFNFGDNVFFQIGPEFSYLVNVNIVYGDQDIKAREVFPDFDLGALIGFQIKISDQMDLQLRYVHGFTKSPTIVLTDMNGSSIGAIEDGKNRVLQAGVSYRLSKDSEVQN